MNENETNTTEVTNDDPSDLVDNEAKDESGASIAAGKKDTSTSDDEIEDSGYSENIPELETEENLSDRVTDLEAKVAELNDKLLRALAETENVRRRAQRDKEDAARYGIKNFAEGILGIADNLGRALDSIDSGARAEDSNLENILVGLEMVQKDLANTFERYGVIPIKALGAKFDPMLHEAMFEIEDKDAPSGTIAQVLEPGYLLNGRTLRAAKVGITKGGPKEAAEPPEDPPQTLEADNPPNPVSRDGQAAYENQTDTSTKSGENLDQEL